MGVGVQYKVGWSKGTSLTRTFEQRLEGCAMGIHRRRSPVRSKCKDTEADVPESRRNSQGQCG